MKKALLTSAVIPFITGLVCVTNLASAGTFTSNTALGNWTDPLAWSYVGDADGVPDTDDDVTIQAGQQINLTTYTNYCNNLTVTGILRATNLSFSVNVYGDYTLTGSESGSYTLSFRKINGTISGAGIPAPGVVWQFANSTTISSNVTATKSVKCRITWGKTVTNLGNFTLNPTGQVTADAVSSKWVNGAGGILTLRSSNFMVGGIKDFFSNSNSLVIRYTGNLPTVMNNQFSSVTINQGTTTLLMDLTCLGSLTVNNTGTLVTGGFDLHVSGNFSQAASGVLTMSSGDALIMEGSALQNMSTASSVTIPNLTIDNSAGVTATSGTYVVSEVLTLTDGLLDLNAATSFTLTSNAATTARIAAVVTGSIDGAVTIEQFISGRNDGYSDMASPMSNNIQIGDWGNELLLIYNYNPPSEYPSAWSYDESAWDYVPVTASTDIMKPGQGFEVYLDSDGSIATPFAATTMNSIGIPSFGPVDISGNLTADNDGWNLVGNPYASFIDFSTFQGSTAGTVGANWMYYDEAISDFVTTSGGEIAAHQGFWIEVLSVPATATFDESHKTTTSATSFRNSSNKYFGLRLASTDGAVKYTSNSFFRFDNSSSYQYEPGIDVTFKKVPAPEAPSLYSLSSEGKKLRINSAPESSSVSYELSYVTPINGSYSISVQNIDFASVFGYTCISLEDKKTGIVIDLSSESEYRFYSSADDMKNRFVLHLSKEGECSTKNSLAIESEKGISILNKGNEGFFAVFEFENETSGVINVYNPLGQQISAAQPFNTSADVVRINVPEDYSGVITISVEVNGKLITKRFFKP